MRCNRLYSNIHTQVCHTGMSQALQVPNVTKNLSMTIEINRRTLHALKGVNNIISKQKRLDNIARPKLLRTPCWRKHFFTVTHDSSHIVSNHLCTIFRNTQTFFHGIKRFFTRCPKCHACHAKPRLMSPSATPARQNEGGCHQVPPPPRKMARRQHSTKCV